MEGMLRVTVPLPDLGMLAAVGCAAAEAVRGVHALAAWTAEQVASLPAAWLHFSGPAAIPEAPLQPAYA